MNHARPTSIFPGIDIGSWEKSSLSAGWKLRWCVWDIQPLVYSFYEENLSEEWNQTGTSKPRDGERWTSEDITCGLDSTLPKARFMPRLIWLCKLMTFFYYLLLFCLIQLKLGFHYLQLKHPWLM
jgi:hypothetical protein